MSSGMPLAFRTLPAIALALCFGSPLHAAAQKAASVRIDNFTFSPAELSIGPGTAVTWTNNDDIPHTVTSATDEFRSGALDTDQQFSFTFSKPGVYSYFCSLHPHMTGKVVVK